MSAFSDFIRNASEDEKKRVYEEVLKRASERQNFMLCQECKTQIKCASQRKCDRVAYGSDGDVHD